MTTRDNEPGESWRRFIRSQYVADITSGGCTYEPLLNRQPIGPNERLAFPHPDSLKRSALLADRIYMPCWADADNLEDMPMELTFGDPQLDREYYAYSWQYNEVFWPWKIEDPQEKLDELLEIWLREPLTKYRSSFPQTSFFPINYGLNTPVLPSGDQHACQGVLNNVPVVIEDDLTWEQIFEFRNDPESRRKYRDLHLWLEQGLSSETERQATDLVAQKLEDYRWAIKKHGMRTSVEAVSSFISLSAVVPAAGGLAAEAMRLEPVWGAVAGGVLAVMGATSWVTKRLLDLKDIKRGQHREVAYLYEIQKLVPNSPTLTDGGVRQ